MPLSGNSEESTSQYIYANSHKYGSVSRAIYAIVIISAITMIAALPFIFIQISVNSQGLLQSTIERTELFIPVSGRIVQVKAQNNQKLKQGDTLLIIDSSLPGKQSRLVTGRTDHLNRLLQDVRVVVQSSGQIHPVDIKPVLRTEQYKASWYQFIQELDSRNMAMKQAERVFNRYGILYKSGVLTDAEYEKFKFDYGQAASNCNLLIRQYKSQCETDANNYRRELTELQARDAELAEQYKLFTLRAPVNGSLQNMLGIQVGSYVFLNQKIAEISPDYQLIALCYVKPSDIGLIQKGQAVSFQIDAFNYNQWGMLSGSVIDISDDIFLSNNGLPLFKVWCSLNSNYLKLKNEYKGYLRKGMSFTARFKVTERTLFQLLYDKVDNWLNPNIRNMEYSKMYRSE